MDFIDVFLTQIVDPFRIGLIAMLMLTATRTSATVGTVVPLVLGVIFVAILIPLTLASGQGDTLGSILVGLVTNSVILGAALAVRSIVIAMSRPKG